MFRIARFAAVAALVGLTLALSGQSMTAVAKPAVAKTTIGDLSATCGADEIAKFVGGTWVCAADDDANTQLDQAGVEALGFFTGAHTVDSDTLGGVTGCASGQVAKSNGDNTWDCGNDDTGGGGSPFTLTDSDGPPVAVGTVVNIDVEHRVTPVRVITLLTNTDISGILMSGEKILLPVVAGAFDNVGAVFFTGSNCSGTPVLLSSAGFLDTILPAVVVGGTLYVASTTTVASTPVLSSQFDDFACLNNSETISNGVDAASEGAVSALFMTPFVLGGGPS